MKKKYGIISDIHEDPRITALAVKILKENSVDSLILNGDIGNKQETLEQTQNHLATSIAITAKTGLETFVQPGGHELMLAFEPVIDYFSKKYPNILGITTPQKFEKDSHDLIFLPGSDILAGGEYILGMDMDIPTGKYFTTPRQQLVRIKNLEQLMQAINNNVCTSAINYANIYDLQKLVTSPEKTIVFCHIPQKFDNLEAIDVAEFGINAQPFYLDVIEYNDGEQQLTAYLEGERAGTILKPKKIKSEKRRIAYESEQLFKLSIAQALIKAGAPIEIKKENKGNHYLRELYQKLGINKAISGHFHESSHRANDSQGRKVQEDKLVDNLFWNSSCLDLGKIGILTVDENKVSYKNINISDYL